MKPAYLSLFNVGMPAAGQTNAGSDLLTVADPVSTISAACLSEKLVELQNGTIWKIGRSEDSEIRLAADTMVSRHHGMVQKTTNGEYFLIDVGSRNGSWVNGRRVMTPILLHTADEILIGNTKMIFHQAEASEAVATTGDGEVTAETSTQYACRIISVLVVDIRDFTGISQRVEETLVCQAIGTWFRHAGSIIEKHGGWSQKYIGDAVMAVWLHKKVNQEHVELTQILRALSEFVEVTGRLHEQFGIAEQFRVGAGLNTGYAMVGNAGSAVASDYTALGDTVNAAFRFETATKSLRSDLVLGEKTFRALERGGLTLAGFTPHVTPLKGYDNPVSVWSSSFKDMDPLLRQPQTAAG